MKSLIFALFLGLPLCALADPSTEGRADPLPPQTKLVDDVLVPVPSEIFSSLDHFASSNWKQVQRPELARSSPGGEQAQTALRLGLVIAEGFIAVEAQDATELRDIGKTARTLALALGVEKSVLKRSNSIVDYAQKGQWALVRKEWSAVNADVEEAMGKLQSEQISQLVSFGGWLRGTEALTVLVLQHYSPENAALLHQPAVLDYFEARVGKMQAKLKRNAIVAESGNIILMLRQLSDPPDATQIPRERVQSIRATVAGVIDAIEENAR